MTEPSAPPVRIAGAAMDRRVARSRWSRARRPAVVLLALASVAGVVLAVRQIPSSGTLAVSAGSLTIDTVQKRPFDDYLPVRAEVVPLRTVYVTAAETGAVESVAVLDGAEVTRDEILARLRDPELVLDVTSREAAIAGQLGQITAQRLSLQQNLTTENNDVASAAFDLLKAQRELGIRQRLHAQGFLSDAGLKSFADEAQYDARRIASLRRAAADDRLVAARQAADIDQTEARLKRSFDLVEHSLDALTVRAPVTGRLTDFDLQPGQPVHAGDAIARIDGDDFRLDADIDEFYLGRVAAGQHATADLGRPVPLTVNRVDPQVTNGEFRAQLVFDHASPDGLRRGEAVETRVTLGATATTLTLPNGPWLEGAGSTAYVVDGNHALRRAIQTGRRNPDQVEILSGLSPGERVITSSTAAFNSFQRLLLR